MDDSPQLQSRPVRWLLALAACAVIGAASFVVFDPTQRLLGRWAGDVFFDERPARYWKAQLLGNPGERAAAIQALEAGGTDAVPLLVTFLNGEPEADTAELRWTAAEILGNIGPDAAVASDSLIECLDDPDPHVRAVCADALPKVGASAGEAVPALIKSLRREPSVVVIDALSQYRAAGAPALPVLAEIVQDRSQNVGRRHAAILAIGEIGPDAEPQLTLLISVLSDDEALLREGAAVALMMLGGEFADECIPPLTTALNDPTPRVRRNALLALGSFGGASRGAIADIQACLDDPDGIVAEAAQTALEMIAPDDFAIDGPAADGTENAVDVSPR